MFGEGGASSEIRALGLIHALQAYSETLANDLVGRDFDVMSINLGGIDSELWDKVGLLEKTVMNKCIQPSVLAGLVCNFL